MENTAETNSRRDFLKSSTKAVAGLSVLSGIQIPYVHAANDDTINIALVGCGGRGTGAASNSMGVKQRTRLIAMADVQESRLEASFNGLSAKHPDRFSVSADSKFIGFDAYKQAIDTLKKGDVVVLATPPAFRWVQFKYAIEKGVNVFMEKPICVDAPSGKRMLELGEQAKAKNMKVAVGLMCRHCRVRGELFDRIQQGEIGDIILGRAYRLQGPVGTCFTKPRDPKADPSEVIYQIKNFHSFLWASGGAFSDFNIHNIDEICWMKNDFPIEAKATGGRTDRGDYVDQNFDHYSVEYTFRDGSKFWLEGRNAMKTHNEFASYVHGSKGMAVISTAGHFPSRAMTFKGQNKNPTEIIWRGPKVEPNPYDLEWQDLIDAIHADKPYSEVERGAKASLVTVMGRMSAHTGQLVTYDQLMAHDHEFAPGVDKLKLDGPAPLLADANGKYPIPQAGVNGMYEYVVPKA
ncbi:MAG: Gfo/Idh/MocA family oxidoreductase [Prosthecobacter sp.]